MTCASCDSSEAGLAQYDAIAELYDGYPGNYLEDISFFLEEAQASGSPVLEIGVGTGRLALPLAAAGLEVVGIDISRAMLRVMARKLALYPELAPRVHMLVADMRQFALGRQFPLVIVPFRTFLYLPTRRDQLRALRAIRDHLAPDGRLIMAFFVPPTDLLARSRTPREEMARFAGPDGGEVIAYDWTSFAPGQRVISHITYEWRAPDGRTVRVLKHELVARYVYPEEARSLLLSCGYEVLASYGDFDRRPLASDSREQIWIAKAAARRR